MGAAQKGVKENQNQEDKQGVDQKIQLICSCENR